MKDAAYSSKDLAVTQGVVAALFFAGVPLVNWFSPSLHKLPGVLHGIASSLTLLVACYMLHSLYPFLRGVEGARARLRARLWITNGLVALSIILGNWLYAKYRLPDGAQEWLLIHAPIGHTVLMECKEFISLMPLPLGVVAGYLLLRMEGGEPTGEAVRTNAGVRSAVALLVTFMWIGLVAGFALGLAIAKLRLV